MERGKGALQLSLLMQKRVRNGGGDDIHTLCMCGECMWRMGRCEYVEKTENQTSA